MAVGMCKAGKAGQWQAGVIGVLNLTMYVPSCALGFAILQAAELHAGAQHVWVEAIVSSQQHAC